MGRTKHPYVTLTPHGKYYVYLSYQATRPAEPGRPTVTAPSGLAGALNVSWTEPSGDDPEIVGYDVIAVRTSGSSGRARPLQAARGRSRGGPPPGRRAGRTRGVVPADRRTAASSGSGVRRGCAWSLPTTATMCRSHTRPATATDSLSNSSWRWTALHNMSRGSGKQDNEEDHDGKIRGKTRNVIRLDAER